MHAERGLARRAISFGAFGLDVRRALARLRLVCLAVAHHLAQDLLQLEGPLGPGPGPLTVEDRAAAPVFCSSGVDVHGEIQLVLPR